MYQAIRNQDWDRVLELKNSVRYLTPYEVKLIPTEIILQLPVYLQDEELFRRKLESEILDRYETGNYNWDRIFQLALRHRCYRVLEKLISHRRDRQTLATILYNADLDLFKFCCRHFDLQLCLQETLEWHRYTHVEYIIPQVPMTEELLKYLLRYRLYNLIPEFPVPEEWDLYPLLSRAPLEVWIRLQPKITSKRISEFFPNLSIPVTKWILERVDPKISALEECCRLCQYLKVKLCLKKFSIFFMLYSGTVHHKFLKAHLRRTENWMTKIVPNWELNPGTLQFLCWEETYTQKF